MHARAATPDERAAFAQALSVTLHPDARGIVAVDNLGRIRGGVLYELWTEGSVVCHIAALPSAGRCLLKAAFAYPFEEAGRRVLLGFIRENNARSRRLARHLGFREVYAVPDGAAPGEALVLVEMRREECRWLTKE